MRTLLSICLIFLALFSKAQNNFSKYFNEAAVLYEDEKYAEAITKFTKAISYKDESKSIYKVVDCYLYRGYCKYKLNNFKDAHNDMNEALKLKPEYLKIYQFNSFIYFAEKDYIGNLANIENGLKQRPTDRSLLMNKALNLTMLHKFNESNAVLESVLSNEPNETSAMKQISSNLLRLKLYDSAIVYLRKVLDINSADVDAYYNLGISYSYKNKLDDAKFYIEKAMSMDTSITYVGYNNLGFFLKLEQGKYQEAIDYFNKAIEIKPDFAYAYSNRGYAKLMLGNTKEAFKDIRKGIDLDNLNSFAYKYLALAYFKDGNSKAGCENLKKAEELGYTIMYDDEVEKLQKERCN